MGIRRRWPDITKRHRRTLPGFSVATLAALLGFIIVQEAEHFAGALTEIAAALLAVLAFGAGWTTSWASGARATDRPTVGMVFVVRNVGIATAIAVTVLGQVVFAVFATAYFLAQAPILLAAVVYSDAWVADRSNVAGVDDP
jgi:ACR3 family arsenite efflux pump ArsB